MWIYSLGVTLRDGLNFTVDDEAEPGDCVTHSDNDSNVVYGVSRQNETINDITNCKNCDPEHCIKKTKALSIITRANKNNNYYVNMNDSWRNIVSVADTRTSMLTSLNHTIIAMCDPNINYRAGLMYLLSVSTHINISYRVRHKTCYQFKRKEKK